MAKETYIIAECGCEHLGNIDSAIDMIWKAKLAGVDCVKFQAYTKSEVGAAWNKIRQYRLGYKDLEILKGTAERWGLDFLVSAFGIDSMRLLQELCCTTIKIPSPCNEYTEMLDEAFDTFEWVYLSTGMCDGLPPHASRENAVVLQCTSAYPCPYNAVNLKHMALLCDGLSDHTQGIEIPVAAVALGADVIEKHFTLDPTGPGPDASICLDPYELADMVDAIRNVEAAMGGPGKQIEDCEKPLLWRKH